MKTGSSVTSGRESVSGQDDFRVGEPTTQSVTEDTPYPKDLPKSLLPVLSFSDLPGHRPGVGGDTSESRVG